MVEQIPGRVLTPIKAIRAKCLDCSNGHVAEVKRCPIVKCPLYPYRMGHRPKPLSDDSEAVILADCHPIYENFKEEADESDVE